MPRITGTVRLAVAVVICLVLAGCEGMKSCSSSIQAIALLASNWTVRCTASYGEISEEEYVSIDLDDVRTFASTVEAIIIVSVESGELQLRVNDSTSMPVLLTARPGAPITYQGPIQVRGATRVTFDLVPALGTVTGVTYDATFSG
jgi:pyruvate kinase